MLYIFDLGNVIVDIDFNRRSEECRVGKECRL